MTATATVKLTGPAARDLTRRIGGLLGELEDLVTEAWRGYADEALGYKTWAEYVETEFPDLPRFNLGKRAEIIKKLHKETEETERGGMSVREIGATMGVGRTTVRRDLAGPNGPRPDPRRVTESVWERAKELAREGKSFTQIAKAVGVAESTVRKDVGVRQAKAEGDPEFAAQVRPSRRHFENSVACDIEPATELIREVDGLLTRLTSGRIYTLNLKDRNGLIKVLRATLERLEHPQDV